MDSRQDNDTARALYDRIKLVTCRVRYDVNI